MNVTAFSISDYEKPALDRFNQGQHTIRYIAEPLSIDSVDRAKGCDAVLIFTNDDASAPILKRLHEHGVRYLVTRSTGMDHIDRQAADALGIQVGNVPRYSPHAIAEHAVALMLALSRQLLRADYNVKRFDFRLTEKLLGFELKGKTAGIVGCGHTGAAVIDILRGFGCRVIAYDVRPEQAAPTRDPIDFVDFPTLLAESDIVSIHVPLNESTKGLFNNERISRMKRGAMLINTGRGGVLDTQDAIEALKDGQLGYLGIDVYENERGLFFQDRSREPRDPLLEELMQQNNVIITGHQAFLTREAVDSISRQTIEHLNRWANG
ncbi:D-lactate dehydrogenase [Nibrella saemangeumensis]|uniref:D-lactate dehydrogenase n=1 Tax=Nibrella saemangeumensis TaxID=1084526 RepID=A0ABP8MNX5_9BACT